jgi:hypothetical protein
MFGTAIAYFFSIHYAIIFTPAEYFYTEIHPYRLWILGLLLIAPVVSFLMFLSHLLGRYGRDEYKSRRETYYRGFTIIVFIFIVLLDIMVFYEMISEVWDMLDPYGIYFFVFCFIFAVIAYRMVLRFEEDFDKLRTFGKAGYLSMYLLGLLMIFYAGIAAYAYTIFPYIPSIKGGANYASAPQTAVEFLSLLDRQTPALAIDMSRVVVIYSTSSAIYVADACAEARRFRDPWKRDRRSSVIVELSRNEVRQITIKTQERVRDLIACANSPTGGGS